MATNVQLRVVPAGRDAFTVDARARPRQPRRLRELPHLRADRAEDHEDVLALLEQFREHLGGELTLAMPDGLGARSDISTFDEAAFERALRQVRALRPAVTAAG